MIKHINGLMLIGWREWCELPELNIPAIKVKIDTGARTSALHAANIKLHLTKNRKLVRFSVYPIQGNCQTIIHCEAPLVDERDITSSNGHREHRYVIRTQVKLGDKIQEIELTLSNRDPLKFRMLLGRVALQNLAVIDTARSFCQGRIDRRKLKKIYNLL
ncbi:MAG: ATP-dependent zinc protease [Proteobacteria bacterium]|nr:ATP-dependent zinc protease [Pseudomonadota bacterium]